ncbi:hypothetical protein JRQ81_005307 [Phrynocephalus forsythii]|uniref:Uncharacterized protein n=1 Tax=Phrynocephalus forsythii TaxID=171643 RepID=A0A9Q1B6L9_9SAUR|nr:hypothetical protein JRQ81_005307 [Phrynocephalus forsythii]
MKAFPHLSAALDIPENGLRLFNACGETDMEDRSSSSQLSFVRVLSNIVSNAKVTVEYY